MLLIILRVIALLIISLSVVTSAQAGIYDKETSFCEAYGTKGASQYQLARAAKCPVSGLRWNSDEAGQAAWCGTVGESIAQQETRARADTLLTCLHGTGRVSDADLTLIPYQLGEELIKVVMQKNVARAKQLLAAGGDLGYEGNAGNDGKILYVAIRAGSLELVKLFIGLGLDPNGTSNGGFNPLSMATGNHALLEYLLTHGADPNNGGEIGMGYPLNSAVEEGDLYAINLLLKHGAVDFQPCEKPTLLDQALKANRADIAARLRKTGAQTGAECDSSNQ